MTRSNRSLSMNLVSLSTLMEKGLSRLNVTTGERSGITVAASSWRPRRTTGPASSSSSSTRTKPSSHGPATAARSRSSGRTRASSPVSKLRAASPASASRGIGRSLWLLGSARWRNGYTPPSEDRIGYLEYTRRTGLSWTNGFIHIPAKVLWPASRSATSTRTASMR